MIQTNLSVDVGNGFSHTAATTKEDEMYLSEPSPELDEALTRTLVLLLVTASRFLQCRGTTGVSALRSV